MPNPGAHPNGAPSTGRLRRRRTLPESRSQLSQLLIYTVSFVSFIVSLITSESDQVLTDKIFLVASVLTCLLFFVELLLRCMYIPEEYRHLNTRYENSNQLLLYDAFYFPLVPFLGVITSLFACIIMYMRFDKFPLTLWYEMGAQSVFFSLLSAFVLYCNVGLKRGPLYDSLWIENSNGLDYGSGMAHSFFHGYLKLVIPKTGTTEPHLEELMKDYEDEHHVKLEFYKLFILIPKSLNCPRSLKNDAVSPSIEESTSLKSKIITVAGVRDRVYKNSVYKIKSERGKRVYVCAEYATPLKTFKDVVSYNGEHSNHYKKHKNDIVLQFYLTLQKVLQEHEDCTNYCELIFYDDKDDGGKNKDVGQILLQRIKKLHKRRAAAS